MTWSPNLVETMKDNSAGDSGGNGGQTRGLESRGATNRSFGPPLRSLAAQLTSPLPLPPSSTLPTANRAVTMSCRSEDEEKENNQSSFMDSSRLNLSQEEVDPFFTQGQYHRINIVISK